MSRTVAIILTVITSCCCGFLAIFLCMFSSIGLIKGSVDLNGVPTDMPPALGIGLICLSVILIAIPVTVGFFSFRSSKPAAVTPAAQGFDGPIPPAS